jgi:DNA replication protein DnaC
MAASSRFDETRMNRIGIPRRTQKDVTGPGFTPDRPAVTEAVRFFGRSDARPFFVLSGGVGCGKSAAAGYAIASADGGARWVKVLIPNDDGIAVPQEVEVSGAVPSAKWVHAFELVKASTFDRTFWAHVESPDLLVVDDLGTMPLDAKGYAAANLSNLLCFREAQDRKTLITTNLTWDHFSADYLTGPGERVRDRMKRIDGMFFAVAGESMRCAP